MAASSFDVRNACRYLRKYTEQYEELHCNLNPPQ